MRSRKSRVERKRNSRTVKENELKRREEEQQ